MKTQQERINVVLKFILKLMRAIMLPHCLHKEKAAEMFANERVEFTIYENVSKYHCRVISFFLKILKKLLFIFNLR